MPPPPAHELYFQNPPPDPERLLQLEDAFFIDIWVRHGTSKMTHRHRLDDVNAFVEPLLPSDRPLELMDVAVSSGISTVEWSISLEHAGIEHRLVAGDAVIDAFLISLGEQMRVLVDRTGYLMQLEIRGRAFRIPSRRHLSRLRFFLPMLLAWGAAKGFDCAAGPHEGPQRPQRRWGLSCRPLKLVCRALLERRGIEIVEDDILSSTDLGQRFHALRAANILNRQYFDESTLSRMLCNLRSRLRPGGLLIVCRTSPDERNHATVFRLDGQGRLSIAARLNDGSEIDRIALALDPR